MLYFFFNRIYGYRKTVIDLNLITAFPDKRSEELWGIRRNYYRHLADLLVETIKGISIRPQEIRERMQLHHDSYALLKQLEKRGQHIFVVLGHYGNWEWASLLAGMESSLPVYALYAPPHNQSIDAFLKQNRSRFGCSLVPVKQVRTLYTRLQQQPSFVAFVADQTPVDTENAYWTKFLHVDTPFFKGYATLAKRTDAIILYLSMRKLNRGVYELDFKIISEHAAQETENTIAERFVRYLEKDIQQRPEYWLWSHRRWKRAGLSY